MFNLNNFSISIKLYVGFGLLGLFLIISGITGYRSTEGLGETLSFITGPAWDTADGAMEGTIGIEQEMLGIEWYLSGTHSKTKAKEMMDEGSVVSQEALNRMTNSGLIEKEKLIPFQNALEGYQSGKQQLLDDFQSYQNSLNKLYKNFYEFQQIMEKAEEIGDGEVETLRNNPNLAISWNNGLQNKWEAADGAMEASIHLLNRIYYFGKIIRNENPEKSKKDLEEVKSDLNDTLKEIINHPVFKKTKISHNAIEKPISLFISNNKDLHIRDFDEALKSYEKYQLSLASYTKLSLELMNQIGIIEETGDGTVENIVDNVADDIAASESLVIGSLLLGLLIGTFSTFLIIKNIKRPITVAKQLANEIASGNFNNSIHCESNDEIGSLVKDLIKMQSNLKESIERDQQAAAENLRIKIALYNVSSNVKMADYNRNIIYMNK